MILLSMVLLVPELQAEHTLKQTPFYVGLHKDICNCEIDFLLEK